MTLSFKLAYDAEGCQLILQQPQRGLLGALRARPRYDLDNLPRDERRIAMALARIRVLDRDNREHKIEGNVLRIAHHLVAQVDSFCASALGLPPIISGYTFNAGVRGSLGSPDFRLDWWWEKAGQIRPLRRVGAIVESVVGPMRLPWPIYKAIGIAESFDPTSPLTDHWLSLGEFRRCFGVETANDSISLDGVLGRIEVITSDRVGLQLDDQDDTKFDAVPFVGSELSTDAQAATADTPLKNQELAHFQAQVRDRGAQPAYNIGTGKFLILDRTAMPVVRAISDAAKGDSNQRRAFIENAARIIGDAIERQAREDGRLNELMSPEGYAEALERAIGGAWTETKEWTSRVIGIAKWGRPVIDQISGSGTSWLPKSIQREVGELLGLVAEDELATLIAQLNEAQKEGTEQLEHRVGTIPVTSDVIEALLRRLQMLSRRQPSEAESDPRPVFLPVTHNNFWDNDFRAETRRRETEAETEVPTTIRTKLKPHQGTAFDWQVKAWRFGFPGVLNADEQGLGKTLQTLIFLTWLAETMKKGVRPMRPMLIVAPTSLLRNWETELATHVSDGTWDPPVRLYGMHLSRWKTTGGTGRDIDDGTSRLDLSELVEADRPQLVITTYQTLVNYAVTFSETDFAVAVFDEIQNLKNPDTMRSEVARAVKADFRIGLTGTPVENSTRDIWAIMDQLFPLALGPMKEFQRVFDKPEEKRMRQLHAAIFTGVDGRPSLGIRRLKKDAAAELPPKVRVLHPRIMPETQAIRYDEVRAKGGAMFALLHHIRRTSLHPGLIEGEAPSGFTLSSARVSAAIDILAAIKEKRERALVFVENRDVQAWFAELIKIEFDLDRIYVINGDTGIDARKEITDRFQRHLTDDRGFDVLVMGPRAAGTGLTLTAANHVIHLTRWWNPAVEEQCNDRTHRIGQSRPVTIHIPLAVHPRLGRNSFDCLLQRLMQRKRGVAEAVLWPQEPNEEDKDLIALYQTVLNKTDYQEAKTEEFRLTDRPDLDARQIGPNVLRVKPVRGGCSIVVAQAAKTESVYSLACADDAAIIIMGADENAEMSRTNPTSVLPDASLWPEYILPE